MAATKLEITNLLLARAKALGNTDYGLKEVCSDLINDYGTSPKQLQQIANGCFLSIETIRHMSRLTETEHGEPYRPNADTCERILRYFGAEIHFNQVAIKGRYRNQPKEPCT